jgi:hypothetical protein
MGYGGAPSWVHINRANQAENNASYSRREASEAKALVKRLENTNAQLMAEKSEILIEIIKYIKLKEDKKLNSEDMESILNKIKDIIVEEKKKSS